eukprot:Em0006g58a
MFYLVLKAIKCHMEIGDTVTSGNTQVLWTELGCWYKPFMPDGIVKENGAISPLRLSPKIWLEMWRILSSPARQMLSHLKHQGSMSRQLWFLGSCMMPLSGLVEVALFSNPAACFSSSGQQEYHIGAGLTWEETKGPPSELQGQFTAPDAAIHSWRHLVHTSAPHSSSSGCERMLEHTAHFSSFSINWLFMLAKASVRVNYSWIFSAPKVKMSY